jgi:hypothetical protein
MDIHAIRGSSPYQLASTIDILNEHKESNNPQSNTTINSKDNKNYLNLLSNVPAKDCFSEIKELIPRPKLPEQKTNPLANLMMVDSFEKESLEVSRPNISAANSPNKIAYDRELINLDDLTA